MKKTIIVPVLVCIMSAGGNAEDVTPTSATIKEVHIYQAGAQVTRNVKATLEAGNNQIRIENLSPRIDQNSISVSGTGDAILTSVNFQLDYLGTNKQTTQVKKLEDSLEIVQSELDRVNGTDQVYTEEMSLLTANKSTGGANVGVNKENLEKIANFFRERMLDLKSKQRAIRKEQKLLMEKQAKLKSQLDELNAKKNQPTGTILIAMQTKLHTGVNLVVSYYVSGAGWIPNYDIRVSEVSKPVKISYKANVFQQTGEEWNDVKLTLSTGNPTLSGVKPVLNTWYLDFYTPPVIRGNRQYEKTMSAPAAVQKEEIQVSGDIEQMDNYVEVKDNPVNVDFEIQIPATVSPDGKPASVSIQSFDLPATYTYYAAPKMDPDAFLLARITGWGDLNLLPGSANIYFDGNFTGKTVLNPRLTLDTMDLSLGRDKRIVLLREKQKDFSKTKVIGGSISKEFVYEISVRNTRKESIEIMLEDQIPVSKNNDIKISDLQYSGGDYNAENGKVTWRLTIPATITTKKQIGYSVKYPKDKVVSGL